MWDSELHLRTHYITCQSLAFNIAKFMAKHRFSETSTSEAHQLHDMVTTKSHSLRETEDLWDEVETAQISGPNDPRHAFLSKTRSNVIYIRGVVDDTMVAIDRYTSPCPEL